MWGQSTSGFTPTMQAWGRERGEAGGACYGPRSNRAYTGNVVVHTNSTKRQTGVIRKPVVNPFRAPIPLPITVRNLSQTTGFSAAKAQKEADRSRQRVLTLRLLEKRNRREIVTRPSRNRKIKRHHAITEPQKSS